MKFIHFNVSIQIFINYFEFLFLQIGWKQNCESSIWECDAQVGGLNFIPFNSRQFSWFIDIDDPMLIQQIYDALKTFTQYCYAPENKLIFPLETGQFLYSILWGFRWDKSVNFN
jgi:hypothetical protein